MILRFPARSFSSGLKISRLLDYYSEFSPSVLSIQQFIDFGTKYRSNKNSFIFLRKELPVRLANIMKEIQLLPQQLLEKEPVIQVKEWYQMSFEEIIRFEDADIEDTKILKKFSENLNLIKNRHSTVVETMAEGVNEMKESINNPNNNIDGRIQYFLDRFYMSRISIRMLIHQHLLLYTNFEEQLQPEQIGSIDIKCDVISVAENAYNNASFVCEQYYSRAPKCVFSCWNVFEKVNNSKRVVMTYVPSHLYHMLFELLKNSMRAVIETHSNRDILPDIKVLISKGREDVTIKISDEGGGIRRSDQDLLFNYMYSTAPQPPSPDAASSAPLAGYGYGLPLSRLYARYFNGDLWLNSVDGYGTDAIISLKVLPRDANELLPIYNMTSSMKYKNNEQIADWSNSNFNQYMK